MLVVLSTSGGCAEPSESPKPAPASSGQDVTPTSDTPMPPTEPRIEPGPDGTLPVRYPLTVTGKVTRLPDGGCLVLVSGSSVYELRGAEDDLPEPGSNATVIGEVRRDLDSRCGGLPLVVDSYER